MVRNMIHKLTLQDHGGKDDFHIDTGLTVDVRKLAFGIEETLKAKHCFNKKIIMAGVDLLQGFLKRHSGLSIRFQQP